MHKRHQEARRLSSIRNGRVLGGSIPQALNRGRNVLNPISWMTLITTATMCAQPPSPNQPQQKTFINFWKNPGWASCCGDGRPWLFCNAPVAGLDRGCCPTRLALLFWNCACVLAGGVFISSCPASPLPLFGRLPPAAPLVRSRAFFPRAATPGFAGDPGGGGCAAFKRSDGMAARSRDGRAPSCPRTAELPCSARADSLAGGLTLCRCRFEG